MGGRTVAPSGLYFLGVTPTWGSRPRLHAYAPSGLGLSSRRHPPDRLHLRHRTLPASHLWNQEEGPRKRTPARSFSQSPAAGRREYLLWSAGVLAGFFFPTHLPLAPVECPCLGHGACPMGLIHIFYPHEDGTGHVRRRSPRRVGQDRRSPRKGTFRGAAATDQQLPAPAPGAGDRR